MLYKHYYPKNGKLCQYDQICAENIYNIIRYGIDNFFLQKLNMYNKIMSLIQDIVKTQIKTTKILLDVKNINACAIMRFSLYRKILNCKKCDSFIFGSGWRWETRYVTLQMIIILKSHLRLPLWVWVETGKSLLMAHTCCTRFAINRVWRFIYHVLKYQIMPHVSIRLAAACLQINYD